MSENYRLIEIQDEPLPGGLMRLRGRLSGTPSRRWTRGLSSRLANQLVGHSGVGGLSINDEMVQGDALVLQAIDESAVPELMAMLGQAVAATNEAIAAHPEGAELAGGKQRHPALAGIPQGRSGS